MTMKKKVLTTLSVVLILGLAALGILAYLTSTDSDVNVMTLGNVEIELIEQQRTNDGSALEPFEQGKELTPLVGSAQGEKDAFGMPVARNYVDKIVSVKNIGDSKAYTRVLVGVPATLEDAGALHWNLGNNFAPNGNYSSDYENVDYPATTLEELGVVNIDGINYNTYAFTYQKPLEKEDVLDGVFVGFYLDSAVDYDGHNYTINGTAIDYDISKGVLIPVVAQAVQTAGFDSAGEAFSKSGLPTNPWTDTVFVDTAAELSIALKAGGTVVLTDDIQVNDEVLVVSEKATLNLNGYNINGIAVISEDETGNQYLISVKSKATLNIIGEGDLTLKTTGKNLGTNNMSSVIYTQGGNLNVDGNININNEESVLAIAYAVYVNPHNSPSKVTLKDAALISGNRALTVFSGSEDVIVDAENCTFKGTRMSVAMMCYGANDSNHQKYPNANYEINLNNCTFKGEVWDYCACYGHGEVITINGEKVDYRSY